jgi:hypothetical protein
MRAHWHNNDPAMSIVAIEREQCLETSSPEESSSHTSPCNGSFSGEL